MPRVICQGVSQTSLLPKSSTDRPLKILLKKPCRWIAESSNFGGAFSFIIWIQRWCLKTYIQYSAWHSPKRCPRISSPWNNTWTGFAKWGHRLWTCWSRKTRWKSSGTKGCTWAELHACIFTCKIYSGCWMLLVSFNPKRQVSMVGLTSSLRLHVASLQEGIKHCFPQATPAEHSVGSGGVSTSATPIPSPTTPSKSEVAVAEPSTKPCAPGFTRRQVWDCKFEVVSLRFNMGQQYHQKKYNSVGPKD